MKIFKFSRGENDHVVLGEQVFSI